MSRKLRQEQNPITILGSELRCKAIELLVNFGFSESCKFVCLPDYVNSHGAADMRL